MTEHADERNWVLEALDRFERPLISYTTRLLGGDVERARDVVQEAFLRLCTECRRDIGRQAELETRLAEWLFKVCRNAALDVHRKERRMESIETVRDPRISDEPGPATRAERKDDVSRIERAIEALPESQQEVLQLRFQHGLTYRELGELTGRTVSNVGVLLHNGLKTLRTTLGSDLGTCMNGGGFREGVTR